MNPEEHYNAAEREDILKQMTETSNRFYLGAVQSKCHPFIEFCGLMNKYIDLCRAAHKAGIDFTNANTHSGIALPVEAHDMAYLAEKLDCIFGPTLHSNPKTAVVLREALFPEVMDGGKGSAPW